MKSGKLRIALVESAQGFGGSLVSAVSLAEGLNPNVFEPILILTSYSNHPFLPLVRSKKIFFKKLRFQEKSKFAVLLNYLLSFLFSVRLAWFCRKNDFQILHFNNGISAQFDEILFISTLPHSFSLICHQRGIPWKEIRKHIFLKKVAKGVNKFIAISHYVKEKLVELTIPSQKVEVIYPPVDLEKFNLQFYEKEGRQLRKRVTGSLDKKIVGMVGCFVEWKGHKVFIEAMQRVFQKRKDVFALLVGDDPLPGRGTRCEIERMVKDLGMSKKILFLGHQNNVQIPLAAMDIFVHASVEPEPFGRVIVEAMGMERAVIATKPGGPEEIVENGVTGFLVPPGDSAALADKILELLSNESLCQSFGKKAREVVLERFNVRENIRQMERLYQEITG